MADWEKIFTKADQAILEYGIRPSEMAMAWKSGYCDGYRTGQQEGKKERQEGSKGSMIEDGCDCELCDEPTKQGPIPVDAGTMLPQWLTELREDVMGWFGGRSWLSDTERRSRVLEALQLAYAMGNSDARCLQETCGTCALWADEICSLVRDVAISDREGLFASKAILAETKVKGWPKDENEPACEFWLPRTQPGVSETPEPEPRESEPEKSVSFRATCDASGDTAFMFPFGTIRACRKCGCLVTGGPTACIPCAESHIEKLTSRVQELEDTLKRMKPAMCNVMKDQLR